MKTVFKILLILGVTVILVISFIGVDDKADELTCSSVELEVEDSLSMGLISKQDVENIIKEKKITFLGKRIVDINLPEVESMLSKSPYIDTVVTSLTANGKVELKVVPKIPAMHIVADNGEEYYIDRRGNDMPLGRITGNLVIATGKIGKKFAKQSLAPLACCIQDSTFWRAQIQQIEVVSPTDVRMYTRIADHTVLLGAPTDIPEKFWRLRVFYEKGLPETGWNKYKTVSVEYNNIVIGSRK